MVSDFDGTICTADVGDGLNARFAAPEWREIDRAYTRGEIGSRLAYPRIAALMQGITREQMLAFALRRARVDPEFPAFVALCRERGYDLKIISDGLDFYIEAVLERDGLSDIEFYANAVTFSEPDRIAVSFPYVNDRCAKCGTCKTALIERFRDDYDRIIYIGDGHSDVCPSQRADGVFAKGILLEKCMQNRTPCRSYRGFEDILRILADRETAPDAGGSWPNGPGRADARRHGGMSTKVAAVKRREGRA